MAFSIDLNYLIYGVVIFNLLLLFLLIVIWMQLKKMQKKYMQMINGSEADNMEEVVIAIQKNINEILQKSKVQEENIGQLKQYARKMKSKLGIVRYNAFGQQGNDLSFSLAIVDEELDGVVLTGIHNREETYLYAKPVEKGQSKYSLSPEEKKIIDQIASKLE
jgi:hypothetical protein